MLNVEIKNLEYNPADKLTTLTGAFEGVEGTAKAPIIIGNP